MEKQKVKNKNDLKIRSYQFSPDVIDFLEVLPRNYIYQTIGKQLLRSATSIGANIIEAQTGRTKRSFANFYQIALKSANETKYWLAILNNKLQDDLQKKKATILLKETKEISNMLGASLLTLKGKRNF